MRVLRYPSSEANNILPRRRSILVLGRLDPVNVASCQLNKLLDASKHDSAVN